MPPAARDRLRRHRRHRDPQRPGPPGARPGGPDRPARPRPRVADQRAPAVRRRGPALGRGGADVLPPRGRRDRGRRRRRPRQAGRAPPSPQRGGHRSTPRMPLPGLVGSDPLWLRACRQVETAFRSGEWLVVCGEPGVGKLALLQAVQLRSQPIRRLEVLDAADSGTTAGWLPSVRDVLAGRRHSLVIRHVGHARPGAAARARRGARQRAAPRRGEPTLGGAHGRPSRRRPRHGRAAAALPEDRRGAAAAPARWRPALAGVVLPRPARAERLPHLLTRGDGDAGARDVAGQRPAAAGGAARGGAAPTYRRHPAGGPAAERARRAAGGTSASSRRCSATRSCRPSPTPSGDKTRAARSLGMSRATIYRKIHDYGIVLRAAALTRHGRPLRRATGSDGCHDRGRRAGSTRQPTLA